MTKFTFAQKKRDHEFCVPDKRTRTGSIHIINNCLFINELIVLITKLDY